MTEIAEKMARLRDEDLLRIAWTDREDEYQPGSVAAARAEVEKRGLPEEERIRIRSEIEPEQVRDAGRATESFGNEAWVALVLFGPFLLWALVPAVIIWGARGYREKVKEAITAVLAGYAVYGLLGLVLVWLLWLTA